MPEVPGLFRWMRAPLRALAIGAAVTVATTSALLLYVRAISLRARDIHFATRTQLPSLKQVALLLLLGPRAPLTPSPPPPPPSGVCPPLISLTVDDFAVTFDEVAAMRDLFGIERGGGSAGSSTKLLDASLAPHIFLQPLMLSCVAHSSFPVSLVGAVHLRSIFNVVNPAAVALAMGTGSSASSNARPVGLRAEAAYMGMRTVARASGVAGIKGVEVVIALRLRMRSTSNVIWEELFVLFKAMRAAPDAAILAHHALAEAVSRSIDELDFTNIASSPAASPSATDGAIADVGGGSSSDGPVRVSAAETTAFGVLSRDVNPIHMSMLGARVLGQRSRIAHGVLVLGKVLARASSAKVGPKLGPFCFAMALKGPVPCGSSVSVVRERAGLPPSSGVESMDISIVGAPRPSIVVRPLPLAAPAWSAARSSASSRL